MKNEKLDGLSALRALACLGIFASHAWDDVFRGFGAMGVSLFIIMSGFTMVYGYYGKNRIKAPSIVENMTFAFYKISRLYPLYILTSCMMAVTLFIGEEKISIPHATVLFVADILLLQEWLPLNLSSINDVSWYLCVVLFSYFIFPWVLCSMEQKYSKTKAKISLLVLLVLQIVFGIIGWRIQSPLHTPGGWWTQDFTRWFVYKFPLTRVIDFMMGCNLGYLFIHQNKDENYCKTWPYTACEILCGGG